MGVTSAKQAVVAQLKEQLESAKGVVLTSYKGLTVAQDTELRRELREAGVSYHVVKNTMLRIAAKEAGNEGIEEHLEGTTAFAFSTEDAVAPAKVICGFIKKNKLEDAEVLTVKVGMVEGKVIGVDTDQSAVIDGGYGEGMTVTSAMKGLAPTTIDTLTDVIVNGNWANYAGKIETLGLVSADDPSANYVQLPLETTQWADGKFTVEDYTALVADMFNGKVKVSNDTTVEPTVSNIAVNYLGNIKG